MTRVDYTRPKIAESSGRSERGLTDEGIYTCVLRSAKELALLEEQWQSLLDRCPSPTFFSTPDWLIPLCEEYEGVLRPLVIAVYESDQLIGLAPFAVLRKLRVYRVLRFLGMGPWRYSWSDHLDIIAAVSKESAVTKAVLGRLLDLSDEWDAIELVEIPETSPILSHLVDKANRLRWVTRVDATSTSYVRQLPDSWEGFLLSLSVNFRQEIERKARKLQGELQVRCEVFTKHDGLGTAMQSLVRLHSLRWNSQGLPGIFAYRGVQGFLSKVVSRLAGTGVVQLVALVGTAGTVAVSLNFRYRQKVYYYTSGFDPSVSYSKYSLGTLLNRYAIKEAIDAGDRAFDFLRGDGEYKTRYKVSPVRHTRLMMWRTRPVFLMDVTMRSLNKRARGLLPDIRHRIQNADIP